MTDINNLENDVVPKKIFTSKTKEYIKEYNRKRYLAQKEKLKTTEELDHKKESTSYFCECCKHVSKSAWNLKIHLLSKNHKLIENALPQ